MALSLLAAGCAGLWDDSPDSAFDPIEQRQRLGGAEPVAIEVEPEREQASLTDEDRGTMRANYPAADHLTTLLQQKSLYGDGIAVGVGVVPLGSLADSTPPPGTTPIEYSPVESAPIVSHQHFYDREESPRRA